MKSLLRTIALSVMALFLVIVPTHAQAPAPPTGLNQQVAAGIVSISWNASAGAVAYIVQVGTFAGGSNLFNSSVGNITAASGSLPAGTYFWRVIAVGPNGALSAPSAESQFTVGGGGACVPPGPPQSFTSNVANIIVSLFWAAPLTGTPPFTYIIEAGSGSGLANLAVLPTGSSATQFATAAPFGTYFVRLRAQNACGVSGVSTEQVVTVGVVPPPPINCTYAVSPAQINVPATGGPIQVNVAASGGCRWQLTADPFIVPAGSTSGTGSTVVSYNVQPTAISRSGAVTIAAIDQGPVTSPQVMVQQVAGGGAGCGVTLNPTSQLAGPGGGEFNVNVSANPGCQWTGTPTMGFITVLLAGSQNGNGTIRYRIDPNPAQAGRTGALRVNTPASGFQDLAITQTGSSALTADFTLNQSGSPEGVCQVNFGPPNSGQTGPPCILDGRASSPIDQIMSFQWRTTRFSQGGDDSSTDYDGPTPTLNLPCTGGGGATEQFFVRLTIRGFGGQTATRERTLQLIRAGCGT